MHRLPIIRDENLTNTEDAAGVRVLHKVPRTLPAPVIENVPVPDPVVRTHGVTRPWKFVNECERQDGRATTETRQSRLSLYVIPEGVARPGVDEGEGGDGEEECVAPDAPALAEPLVTYSACYDQITFTFPGGLDGNTVRIETSTSEWGPWVSHIVTTANSVTFDNIFPADVLFRVSVLVVYGCTDGNHEDWIPYSEVFALENVSVQIPTLVSFTNTTVSTLGLPSPVTSLFDGLDVSVLLSPNVGDGVSAVEVRHRLAFDNDLSTAASTNVPTFSHPDGTAVIKWTKDNTRPTAATVNPASNNAQFFAHTSKCVIRARAFVGSCGSPELVIVVDKVTPALALFTHHGTTASVSNQCVTDPAYPGSDCSESYGSEDGFRDFLRNLACASMVAATISHVIWKQEVTTNPSISGGYAAITVSVSQQRYGFVSMLRTGAVWDNFPAALHTYLQVDTGFDYVGTTLTGVGGTSADVEAKYDSFAIPRNKSCKNDEDGTDSVAVVTITTTPFPP